LNAIKLNEAQSTYLDFLRGMAALLVLFGHASHTFLNGSLLQRSNIEVGAVMVFFLLSGFLISYTAFRRYNDAGYGFREFAIDRFARIYTAFIPALVFVALLDAYTATLAQPLAQAQPEGHAATWLATHTTHATVQNWFGNLLMLQDFPLFQVLRLGGVPESAWFIDTYGSAAPFWTISVEWWIYMVFGALVVVRLKGGKPFKLWQLALLGLVAIEPAYYLVGGVNNCLTLLWIFGMLACLLLFHNESLLAKMNWQNKSTRFKLNCLLVCVGALGAMAVRLLAIKLDRGEFAFAELQFGLFMAVAVFAPVLGLIHAKAPPRLLRKAAAGLAHYSFSLYLTHASVLAYFSIRYGAGQYNTHNFWLAVGASNLVAIAFWWLFERHYHRIGKWLKKATA